jgi:hypothetical protein
MKKQFSVFAVIIVLSAVMIQFSSCKKDEGKLPNISFKTTAGYTYQDGTITAGNSFLVGINASKSEGEDVLKTLNISKSIDGAATVTDTTITIPSAQEDSYSGDFVRMAGAAGHTEKWTYTVTNRDGITNAVNFTLTVN